MSVCTSYTEPAFGKTLPSAYCAPGAAKETDWQEAKGWRRTVTCKHTIEVISGGGEGRGGEHLIHLTLSLGGLFPLRLGSRTGKTFLQRVAGSTLG